MTRSLEGLDVELRREIEHYMLDCNYPKLERLAKRQRRQQNISTGIFFLFAFHPLKPWNICYWQNANF